MLGFIFFGLSIIMLLGFTYYILRSEIGHKASIQVIWLYCGVVLSLLIAIIGLQSSNMLPTSWKDSALGGICIIGAIACWVHMLTWPWRKKQAGTLVLDLGRPNQLNYYFTGLGVAMLGIFLLAAKGYSNALVEVCFVSFIVSLTLLYVFLGSCTLEIRKKGILYSASFISWERVRSYDWSGEMDATLTVKIMRRLPFFKQISWPVPPERKDIVERTLLLQSIFSYFG